MTEDEDMTDASQMDTQSPPITQSGSITQSTQSGSNIFTSYSNIESEPMTRVWGRIDVYKVINRRFGRVSIGSFDHKKIRSIDLVNEKTTFGRKADCDCNLSDLIDQTKLSDISNIHFTLMKNNGANSLSPVFLEDSSKNGTFFHEQRKNGNAKCFGKGEPIDSKSKRRILANNDVIFVEKKPTICFEFFLLPEPKNDLPADINKEYYIGKELGNGACGSVYFAQNRQTCKPFAIKYTTSEGKENNTVAMILKEVKILQQLQHPCILKLFKMQSYTSSVAMFVDYMNGGDLYSRILKQGYFSESFSKFIFYQICRGIEYLHAQNVIHRDLKPDNILLASTDQYTLVKVADFGLSKCIASNSLMMTQCGTVGYLAPEVRTSKYTNKVDIWSLGVVLYNCFTGRYPFTTLGSSFSQADKYSLDFGHEEMQKISNAGKQIIYESLQIDGARRPSVTELLSRRDWLSPSDVYVQKAIDVMNMCE